MMPANRQLMTRPNILYLVHRVPFPPDKGDRIRAFHLLKYLSHRANVFLACLADEPVSEEAKAVLKGLCDQLAIVQLSAWLRWFRALGSLVRGRTISEGAFQEPALLAVLREWMNQVRFDVSLISASSLIPYLRIKELREVPAVVDLVDVDSQKWLDYAAACRGPKTWLYRTEGRRLRRLECSLSGSARAATLVSPAEVEVFRQFCSWDCVHSVTNGVDLDYFSPPTLPAKENCCVFVGALDYRPNVDAACWFCSKVWPEIHRRRPDARLRLVGRRPALEVCRLSGEDGVDVVGQVPDVRPYLAEAAVVIAPLRIARGVQNKVLEAMAMAKPVLASPQALAGLEHKSQLPALAATSPHEWINSLMALFEDDRKRRELGAAGRRFVKTYHSWEHCLEPFDLLLGLSRECPEDKPTSSLDCKGRPSNVTPASAC
jgi:sugar transferase (PEP-CTERM/EpsH1 system associated)